MDEQMKDVAGPAVVQRFSFNLRMQHIVLFVSVLLLIGTGAPLFCLKHPEWFFWGQDAPFIGSLAGWRFWHRVGAVILIAVSAYHLLYTFYTREGRREFIAWLPTPKDFVDVTQNSMYFLGLSKKRPRYDRYSYFEKFDYWAVYWGNVIMIGTGLVLWFDKTAARVVPWFDYELASFIHSHEAILATLALLIWHFYNVHFNPDRFPGSLLWWNGRITREEMLEEHPLEYEKIVKETQGAK